jgi:hypothetical protein
LSIDYFNLAPLALAWQCAHAGLPVPSNSQKPTAAQPERRLLRHVVDPSTARSIIMRNSTAYLAGVATVFSATALGFAGAMVLTNATTPQPPAEHAKLERSVASPAQASPSVDTKLNATANSSGTAQGSNQEPAPPAVSPAPNKPAQQAATNSPPAQTSSSAQTQSETSAQPAISGVEQSSNASQAQASQAKSAANAYARSSDEDVRRFIRRRERHWARRHYRDDDTTIAAQDAKSGQNIQSQPSASDNQPSLHASTQPTQIKSADQTSAKVDDPDSGKMKRKHDRRWTSGRSTDHYGAGRDDDWPRSFEARQIPEEDAPQTFFGTPRWRPFFGDSDDD